MLNHTWMFYFLIEGFEFMTVSATDADDPKTYNADIGYSILGQIPAEPNPNMFAINPVSGAIRVNADGLDREVSVQITFLTSYFTYSFSVPNL